jgi:hypothetical protein
MSELLVFISSIMDKQREDLFAERDAAKEAVASLELTRAWRFEDSPASSLRVDYSYLNKVAESDIFLLLLGRDITAPVRMEYDAAANAGKPLLVFLKSGERTPETQAFVKDIKVKWKSFEGIDALRREVRAALAEELIEAHRQRRVNLPAGDIDKLNAVLPPSGGIAVGSQTGGFNLAAGASIAARNVAGGNVTETRSAGRDYHEARDHGVINIGAGGASELTALLTNLSATLAELKLQAVDQKRVLHAIEGARIEAEAPAPDKHAFATRLQEAADIVRNAGTVVLETTAFGKLLAQGLAWAGQAASILLG